MIKSLCLCKFCVAKKERRKRIIKSFLAGAVVAIIILLFFGQAMASDFRNEGWYHSTPIQPDAEPQQRAVGKFASSDDDDDRYVTAKAHAHDARANRDESQSKVWADRARAAGE